MTISRRKLLAYGVGAAGVLAAPAIARAQAAPIRLVFSHHLPVTHLGSAVDPWGNARVGFDGEITINRKDFGLNWNAALEAGGFLVGDEVKISVSVQAIGV